MKISSFRRFSLQDFPDLPQTMESFIQALNTVIEELVDAANGKLTFGDNIRSKIVKAKLLDSTDTELTVEGIGKPAFAMLSTPIQGSMSWRVLSDNRVSVNVTFAGAPTGLTEVSVLFVGA